MTNQDAMNVIPNLPSMYDEPFSDSSQIPTYLVSKIAKEKVTVSLTGDAGDELFGGYSRYNKAQSTWKQLNRIPLSVRRALASITNSTNASLLNAALSPISYLMSANGKPFNLADKLLKASKVADCQNIQEFYYKAFMTHSRDASELVLGSKEQPNYYTQPAILTGLGVLEKLMASDINTYLMGDILTKVDRAGMANSLETRIPFLDQNVVDFAWRLPEFL